MKRMFFAAFKKDKDNLLNELIKLSCIDISSPEEGINREEMLALLSHGEKEYNSLESDIKKFGNAIEALERFDKSKRPLFAKLRSISPEEAKRAVENSNSAYEQITHHINNLNTLKSEENKILANIEALKPYEELDLDLTVSSTKRTNIVLGTIEPQWTDLTIDEAITSADLELVIEILNSNSDEKNIKNEVRHVLVIYPKDREEESISFLKTLGFQKAVFRDIKTGTAKENIEIFNARLNEISKERMYQEDALKNMVHLLPDLKAAYDMLSIELQK
jgi:V/A-type H+-transporting ATPase subunit I